MKYNNQNECDFSITLPNYLIKYLLKLICVHINDRNENREIYEFNKINYDSKEKEKQLKVKLSLVCWDWFNCISRNINVSIDFKYFNHDVEKNKYIIMKNKNIQVLKLVHYDNLDPNYEESLIMKLSQFKNLKKIIICRRYTLKDLVHYPQTFTFDFFNRVLKGINKNASIKVDIHLALYCNCFGFLEVPLEKCTFKVNKIQIDSCCEDPMVIYSYFEYFNPKKLVIIPTNLECHYEHAHLNLIQLDKWMLLKNISRSQQIMNNGGVYQNKFEMYGSNHDITDIPISQINYFENSIIESLDIKDSFSVRELFYLVFYLPQIKYLSVGVCLSELIEQFLISQMGELNNTENNPLDFKFYWDLFRKRLISNKSLINLTLHNKCSHRCGCCNFAFKLKKQNLPINQQQTYDRNETPIDLIQQISEIFEINSSIKSLKLINFNSDINKYLNNNNIICNRINLIIQK